MNSHITLSTFLKQNPFHLFNKMFDQVKKEKLEVYDKIDFGVRIFESDDGQIKSWWEVEDGEVIGLYSEPRTYIDNGTGFDDETFMRYFFIQLSIKNGKFHTKNAI